MNQILSGGALLGVVVLIAIILFAIAYFIKPKAATGTSKAAANRQGRNNNANRTTGKQLKSKKFKFQSKPGTLSGTSKPQLIKLKKQITKHFPDFNVTLREQHLILERNAKKVAMLTLDANAVSGRRRLGDVSIINFHKPPSVEELRIELSGI